MNDGLNEEFQRSRAERRRLAEMSQRMRMENERAVRLVLDEYFPEGVPADLLERICMIQNSLIRDIVTADKVTRELHDGINRIGEEAAQRWVNGFKECADQVRTFAAELNLSQAVVDSLLRNDSSVRETEAAARDQAATQQVEWSRT